MSTMHRCADHRRYTAGCDGCNAAQAAYRAGSCGDGNRVYNAARQAAYRRLAAEHEGRFAVLFAEERAARSRMARTR